jgi:hypothetical protein
MSAGTEWERIRQANEVRRDRMAKERDAAMLEMAANATPETIRHRQVRVVDELTARGSMPAESRRAALEINEVWMLITGGLFAKVQRYDRAIRGVCHDNWPPGCIAAYHERYIPWRDYFGALAVHGQGSLTVADLVFFVAVDNLGVQQIAESRRMCRKSVLNLVRTSLYWYAENGGWLDVSAVA